MFKQSPLLFPQFVYTVNRCPPATAPRLAEMCHKEVEDSRYSVLLDVPVMSTLANTVYANIFCAKCHHDKKLHLYKHEILCNCQLRSKAQLTHMKYLKGVRTWISPSEKNINCSTPNYDVTRCTFSVDYLFNEGRACEPIVISKCIKKLLFSADDEEKCASYNYYVEGPGGVYKNPYCALCNNVSLKSLRCFGPLPYLYSPKHDLFTLSDLFSTNSVCSDEEILDPISDECLNFDTENSTKIMSPAELINSAGDILFIILTAISLVAMLMHMIIFLLVFDKRNLNAKNLFSMTCSLFLAELLLLICSVECSNVLGCYISTIIVYYLFMVAFFWMNVMSYDVCKTFHATKRCSRSHRLYIKYALYSFVGPAVLVAIAILVDQVAPEAKVSPGFGDNGFWFSNKGGLILFFIAPTELIFLSNIGMLGVTIYDIHNTEKQTKDASSNRIGKDKNETDKFLTDNTTIEDITTEATTLNQIQEKIKEGIDRMRLDKARLVLCTKLALIMGTPWFFASFDELSVICKYIFNILNSLQGLFIFLAFDCQSKIFKRLCERLGWESMAQTFGTSSTGATQESSLSNNPKRVTEVLSARPSER